VVFPELERDFIRMRTREALQVKKENGVTLGRPRSTPDDVVARVCGQPMADMLKRCGGA
jgi:DNA invertase Pin-like site-specific DNA recombinase